MNDKQFQPQERILRAGFYNSDAFKEKQKKLLVLKTAIAGIYYHIDMSTEEGKQLMSTLTPGTELRLFRDTDNIHDKWAVSVYTTDDVQIGYITRFKNETIARLMDDGKVFYAYIDEQPEPPKNETERRRTRAATEDYRIPFSVYMDI